MVELNSKFCNISLRVEFICYFSFCVIVVFVFVSVRKLITSSANKFWTSNKPIIAIEYVRLKNHRIESFTCFSAITIYLILTFYDFVSIPFV